MAPPVPPGAAAAPPAPATVLDIGELAGTIESERHRNDFRKFLRNLDKTPANAAPEIKGEKSSLGCLISFSVMFV